MPDKISISLHKPETALRTPPDVDQADWDFINKPYQFGQLVLPVVRRKNYTDSKYCPKCAIWWSKVPDRCLYCGTFLRIRPRRKVKRKKD